ncbi:hypothetical protein [Aureimonas sp. AU40]|uniref:hypothetical protein n=1 Tax=Aureimonas sp. AU40 TaxID=1637747 RepID=UPI0007829CFD|nr:hypothetical protein [Aureimonas sp. AU40]
MSGGWIGVDLDGTLAHYDGWKGIDHIGAPVPAMMKRVRGWLAAGKTVKIMTARVCSAAPDRGMARWHIQNWFERQGLPRLEVVSEKDFGMVQLWDDRAIRVEENTGRYYDQISGCSR